MWQLSRQNISRKLKGRTFFEPEHLPFEKKQVLVRLEPRTFVILGVFITTRVNVRETLNVL